MHAYRVFGRILHSDLEFPELARVDTGPAAWTLTIRSNTPPEASLHPLGAEEITPEACASLYRFDTGYRLVFGDTGTFDITDQGRSITWFAPPDADLDDVRTDITGRVLATALHAAGTLCLHGSAVAFDDRAIGFLAPKFHGKSTIALATLRNGARLLTDDTLPTRHGPPPVAQPGIHVARLWHDSAARLAPCPPTRTTGDKLMFATLDADRLCHHECRLDALYILAPAPAAYEEPAAWRTRLPPTRATLLLVGNAKIGALLSGPEGPALVDRAADLARTTPVFRLGYVRDYARLDDVAATLAHWHSTPATTPADSAPLTHP